MSSDPTEEPQAHPQEDSRPARSSEMGEEDGNGKWYPGKFLNRLKQTQTSQEEKLVTSPEPSGPGSTSDDEERKNESMICSTVRSIRLKYLERQLIGRIYLYRLSGVISTAVTSDVTTEDVMNFYLHKAEIFGQNSLLEEDPLIQAEVTGQYKRALSTVDTILNSLERRSLAYSTADFTHTTLLTRGTTIGVSDPFFGLIGFSFTLELSATAHSLLASRRRYEITRDLALEKQREDEERMERERVSVSGSASSSGLSKISFSFFGNKKSFDTSSSPASSSSLLPPSSESTAVGAVAEDSEAEDN
jgi:hypothetical protein